MASVYRAQAIPGTPAAVPYKRKAIRFNRAPKEKSVDKATQYKKEADAINADNEIVPRLNRQRLQTKADSEALEQEKTQSEYLQTLQNRSQGIDKDQIIAREAQATMADQQRQAKEKQRWRDMMAFAGTALGMDKLSNGGPLKFKDVNALAGVVDGFSPTEEVEKVMPDGTKQRVFQDKQVIGRYISGDNPQKPPKLHLFTTKDGVETPIASGGKPIQIDRDTLIGLNKLNGVYETKQGMNKADFEREQAKKLFEQTRTAALQTQQAKDAAAVNLQHVKDAGGARNEAIKAGTDVNGQQTAAAVNALQQAADLGEAGAIAQGGSTKTPSQIAHEVAMQSVVAARKAAAEKAANQNSGEDGGPNNIPAQRGG